MNFECFTKGKQPKRKWRAGRDLILRNVGDYFYLTACIRCMLPVKKITLVGEWTGCPIDDVGNKF